MLSRRMKNYFAGIVVIRISGNAPERFINLCLLDHILLWGIHKHNDIIYARMRLQDIYHIRTFVRKSGCKVCIQDYYGLPFLAKRLKRRKMLVIGALLFVIVLNSLGSYIWFVNVIGTKSLSEDEIIRVAAEAGLKPGLQKAGIDLHKVESLVLANLQEVTWVSINYTGTRAVIEVVEKTLPKQEDKTPTDIVAAKACVIEEIIVVAGKSVVQKGDTVRKGDLLIKGVIETKENPENSEGAVLEKPVKASGIIKGRVWYEGYGEAELSGIDYQRTGEETIGIECDIGNRHFILKAAPKEPYNCFEYEKLYKKMPLWRNTGLAVETIIMIYRELKFNKYQIAVDEAREIAKNRAISALQKVFPENAYILSRNIEVLSDLTANPVRVKVCIETLEDIAQ